MSPFDTHAYNTYDDHGKAVVKAMLLHHGHIIVHNPDRYSFDLYSDKDGNLFRWEVEVKRGMPWSCEQEYPYDTVSFLGRKAKWRGFPFWYCIINEPTSNVLMCHSSMIFQETYRVTHVDRWSRGTETKYHVPKELCTFVKSEQWGGGS